MGEVTGISWVPTISFTLNRQPNLRDPGSSAGQGFNQQAESLANLIGGRYDLANDRIVENDVAGAVRIRQRLVLRPGFETLG